jgi:methanethiol S-methyltransferase
MKLSRTFVLVYGTVCYLLHWLVTVYLIGFIGDMWWSRTIDVKLRYASTTWALSADLLLICLFIALHWLMARQWFKRWWTHWVPEPIERSTYVLTTCLVLALLFWTWQPVRGDVWVAGSVRAASFLTAVYLLAWVLAIYATFPINHWDLFGIRQAWLYWLGQEYTPPKSRPSVLYRLLPHPIFVGYAVALWAAPRMGWSRFLLSAGLSAFLLIDVRLAANEG